MSNINVFINKRLKIDNSQWDGNAEERTHIVDNIFQILDELQYHPDTDVYYNSNELNHLISNIQLWDTENDYALTNEIDIMAAMLHTIYATDVLETQLIDIDNERYFYWDVNSFATSTEISTSLIAASAKSIADGNTNYLLTSFDNSEFTPKKNIPIIREKYSALPILINISPTSSENIYDFITNKRTQRVYKHNPKHGENGRGEYKGASKLYCSTESAEHYLKYAVGLVGLDELFYFDEDRKLFIKYRFNGEQNDNTFHGFHIEIKDEFEQVPIEIRRKYRTNYA